MMCGQKWVSFSSSAFFFCHTDLNMPRYSTYSIQREEVERGMYTSWSGGGGSHTRAPSVPLSLTPQTQAPAPGGTTRCTPGRAGGCSLPPGGGSQGPAFGPPRSHWQPGHSCTNASQECTVLGEVCMGHGFFFAHKKNTRASPPPPLPLQRTTKEINRACVMHVDVHNNKKRHV